MRRFLSATTLIIVGFLITPTTYLPDEIGKIILAIIAIIAIIGWDFTYDKLKRKQI